MNRDAIIPQRARARSPVPPQLNIDILLIHIEQVSQNQVALRLVQTNNPICHGTIDEEGLPACGRMNPHKRMFTLNVLRSGVGILAVKIGVSTGVDCGLAVDHLAELWREFLVGAVPRRPESVTPDLGNSIVVQMRDSRRLALVDEITGMQVRIYSSCI